MAVFQVDIEKRLGDEFWTNVYYIQADTIVAASFGAIRMAQFEQYFHKNSVVFTQARTRTQVPGDDVYVNSPLNFSGLMEYEPANRLPLFNVLRVDFGAATGRPSRKYYRMPLEFGDVVNGQVLQAIRDVVTLRYSQMQSDFGTDGLAHVDTDGQLIISAVPSLPVGMRQLRRGSKRRSTPVLQ